MRVTNKMLSTNFLRDMRTNLGSMQILQGQLTSGKEIRKPSDNPFKSTRVMQLYSDINANKQYNENIKDTSNWLDVTDTALNQAENVFARVRELLVSAGNPGHGPGEREAIKDEINEKIGELGQILNTTFDGKYVFGGTKVSSKPLGTAKDTEGDVSINYIGKDGNILDPTKPADMDQINFIKDKLTVEISQGVTMDYNVNASQVIEFKTPNGTSVDVRTVLNDITKNLSSGATEDEIKKLTSENLQNVDDILNNINKLRAEVGAKQNRMEAAADKNSEENFNMTEILSKTEDIDFTEKVMELATSQTVYMAALQTSAKIIQPSLLDYVR